MKKHLLPENGQFYKANLHSHSTVSDGKLTPAEMKELYREAGYSILAFTDHCWFRTHNELTDADFLALNGYEMDIAEKGSGNSRQRRTCHVCFIAGTPERDTRPENHDHICDETPGFVKEYSVECLSEMMEAGRREGFFVTYNHPVWSQETREQYCAYHGMHAMEICNFGSYNSGYPEYNAAIYDEMLCAGRRIGCIGADDNHNDAKRDSRAWDSFGAWTVIKAERLDYPSVMAALLRGDYYASQGPKIYALWIEGNRLHVECSAADRVYINTAHQYASCVWDEDGSGVTHAVFTVIPEFGYVRVTVEDQRGRHADTRAYFIDELLD